MINLIIIASILILTGTLPLLLLFLKKTAFDFKKPIVPFVWLTAVATLYEWVGTALLKINATYWFQIYSLLCFCALYYFFLKLLNRQYKKVFSLFLALFIITYSTSFFFFDKTNAFTSSSINDPLITLMVLFFSFLWFKKLFEKTNVPNLWKDADFYFISGLMIYHFGTFFFFLLSSFIFNSNSDFYDYWMVNIVATVVLRIFISIGVWKMK